VTKRLMNGEYITCLRNRDKFDKNELDIAKDYFLEGLSMKKIAKKRDSTYYHVRKTLKKIQGLIACPLGARPQSAGPGTPYGGHLMVVKIADSV
jgi:hypothetical protein